MSLNLPNAIAPGQSMDPRPIQANFDAIESAINDDLIHRDGSRSMTAALTLSGNPTAGLHASTKQYVDAAVAAIQDDADAAQATADDAMPKAGGTFTGAPIWASDPSGVNQLTRKSYVDAEAAKYATVHDALQDEGSGTAWVTTTATTVASVAKSGAGSYMVVAVGDFDFISGGDGTDHAQCVVELEVDGVTQSSVGAWRPSHWGERGQAVVTHAADLGSGSHTFNLRVRKTGATGSFEVNRAHCKITVLQVT